MSNATAKLRFPLAPMLQAKLEQATDEPAYDAETQTWQRLHDNLISGENQRNAYWQACVGADGTLHVSFNWRETWGVETNHDICYAKSEDGGETYGERHVWTTEAGLTEPQSYVAVVLPDGSLVVGLEGCAPQPDGTRTCNSGGVVWSGDGARTWTELTPEASGWAGDGVEDMELGRDGRLYVATRNGVWRSSGALPVASETPPEASGARLRITPNPVAGAARIALSLAAPEAARLAVYDARGREVYGEASGARGEHAWEVRTERWAAGVYVVRAEVGGEAITAHLTVAR